MPWEHFYKLGAQQALTDFGLPSVNPITGGEVWYPQALRALVNGPYVEPVLKADKPLLDEYEWVSSNILGANGPLERRLARAGVRELAIRAKQLALEESNNRSGG